MSPNLNGWSQLRTRLQRAAHGFASKVSARLVVPLRSYPSSLVLAKAPGLKLGVEVEFMRSDGALAVEKAYVPVPKSDSNIGEHDRIRNQAVQDNFMRVKVPVPPGAKSVKIVATDPGVVIDRVGVSVKR